MTFAFSTDPSFSPFQFTRNTLEHIIAAADPADYPNRPDLRYELTLNAPEYPGLQILQPFITLPGREKPAIVSTGESVFEGAKFSMQAEVDGLLSREKPSFRQSQISVISSLTMPFSFKEVVKYDGVEIRNQTLPPQWAIKAGLSELDHDAWGTSYWTHYHKNRFLTWQPDNKIISSGQEEYLYFLLNFSPSPEYIKLRVDVTYTDASSEEIYPLMPIRDVPFGRVLCVPIGPSIVLQGIAGSVAAGAPVNYQAYLVDQEGNRLSEKRTYWLDRRARRQDRAIMFSNSFQTYDTLRLVGDAAETHKVQRFYADRERPMGAGSDFSDLFMIDKVGTREVTISTGYFESNNVEMIRYLSELLLAEEWFMISDKAHEPLELMTTSQISSQDSPGLESRTYVFRYIRDASNYSFLPTAPAFPVRETYWKGSKPQFVLDAYGKRTGFVRYGRIVKTYSDTNTAFVPLTTKSNSPGDVDYIQEYRDASIVAGSTPFPSLAISRLGSFKRSTCGVGQIGAPLTITIPAGKYGGENEGEADAKAEAEFISLNTQAYANQNGACEINTIPFKFGLFNKTLLTAQPGYHVAIVDLRINGNLDVISNTSPELPPVNRLSENQFNPGVYDLVVEVEYANYPEQPCQLLIPSKNRRISVANSGLYTFYNVTINSSDNPLTIEVV